MQRWILDWDPSTRFPHYTRANAGEVLPDPVSPLGWSLVWEHGLLVGGRQGFLDFGVYRPEEVPVDRPPMFGVFGGYFYVTLSGTRLMAIRMGSTVEAGDAAFVGSHPDVPPYVPHPDDDCPECSRALGASAAHALSADSYAPAEDERVRIAALRAARPDLTALSPGDLVARMRGFRPGLAEAFRQHMYVSLASTIGPGVLAQLCAAAGAPELHLDLLSGLGEVTSAAPSRELWQLSRLLREEPELLAALEHDPRRVVDAARDGQSRFATGLARFLVDRGFYGPSGWDLLAPSWEVEPGQLVGMLRRLVRSPESEAPEHAETRLAQRRVEAAAVVRARLASDESAAATFDASLRSTSVFVAAREQTKANATRLINEVRVTALELGRRAVESGALEQTADVSMVLESELDEFAVDPVRFVPVVHERRAYLARLHEVEPPFIIGPSGPPPAQWRRRSTATVHDEAPAGTRLTAIGCSPGTYRGRVRVIRQVDDDVEIDAGDILVAPFSDVGWTPLFLVAGAAVLEVGSMNSHAAVISRELGIPCVVSLGGATDLLRDGAVVTVDGTAGSVTVDDPAPPPPS